MADQCSLTQSVPQVSHNGPGEKVHTWRILDIPASVPHQTLRSCLEEYVSQQSPQNLQLKQLSVAPEYDEFPTATATVTFSEDPTSWRESGNGSFDITTPEGESHELYFDKDFEGFTPLYAPQLAKDCAVDIIAVTGLAGHALGSWKATGNHHVWLRDFLPRTIPQARILVYGYNTDLQQKVRTDTIRDLTKTFYTDMKVLRSNESNNRRPLILIGHSLGGLIVKESITLAWNDVTPSGINLFKCLYAMMTFGAPNLGLRNESLIKVVKGQLNEALISNLVTSSESEPTELLKTLNDHFVRSTRKQGLELMLCYERNTTPLLEVLPNGKLERGTRRALIVTEISATFVGRPVEESEQRAISRDHSQMVKFVNPNDRDYKFVASTLKGWVTLGHADVDRRFHQHTYQESHDQLPVTDAVSQLNLKATQSRPSRALIRQATNRVDTSPNSFGQKVTADATMKSLAFEGMHFRRDNIKTAATDTCKWLAENDQFDAWIHGDIKMLWISGNPGTGKSVLMHYAVDFCQKSRGEELLVFHFFFHGRGSELQHSITGLLRSLCHQLICIIPQAHEKLARIYTEKCKQYGGPHWSWSDSDLKNFFEDWVFIADGRRKLILVDALDEAGREAAVELVNWFKSLVASHRHKANLGICFSCRHYPIIDVDQSQQIVVEHCNTEDIRTWVTRQLATVSKVLTPAEIDTITQDILCKAQGVFLWAAIIVPKTVYLCLDAKPLKDILALIREIPVGLQEIYEKILEHKENVDLDLRYWLFAWLCFSPELFSVETLAVALQHSTQSFEKADYSKENLKRMMLVASCGFCEFTARQRLPWDDLKGMETVKAPIKELRKLLEWTGDDDISMDGTLVSDGTLMLVPSNETERLALLESFEKLWDVQNHMSTLLVSKRSLQLLQQHIYAPERGDVQLIHQSVKDFFLKSGFAAMNPEVNRSPGVDANIAHQLARKCLTYLQQCQADKNFTQGEDDVDFKNYCRKHLSELVGIADRNGLDQSDLVKILKWPHDDQVDAMLDPWHTSLPVFALSADAPSLISYFMKTDWTRLTLSKKAKMDLSQIARHVFIQGEQYVDRIFTHPEFKPRNRLSNQDTYLTCTVKILGGLTVELLLWESKDMVKHPRVQGAMCALKHLLAMDEVDIDALDPVSRFTALDLADIFHLQEAADLIRAARSKRIMSEDLRLP